MPHPPGVTQSDLERGGIIDTFVPCPDCSSRVGSDDPEEHKDWCDLRDVGFERVAELAEEERHPSYDDIKDEV